jgi:hypothetical protein
VRGPRWIQEWRTDDFIEFRLGRDDEGLVAEWGGLGQLCATRSGDSHRFTPHPEATARAVEKLMQGPVQALLRHLRGRMSLHASAAARDGAGFLFLGASTSGKSTFAAELCCREGFAMMADDVAFLEEDADGFVVIPSESTHWLRDDAATLLGAAAADDDKTPLAPTRVADSPVRLQGMVYLTFDESSSSATLRRAQGPDAFRWLRTSLFRFVIDEPEVALSDFGRMAALYEKVPLCELIRRRSLANLEECVDLLRNPWPIRSKEHGNCL